MPSIRIFATLGCALASPLSTFAANAIADEFFRQKVEPILRENCFKCHSHSAEKIKGGLLLDSRSAAMEGGDSGPVLVAGHPEKSPLIEAVRYANEDLQMPPNGKKLSNEQIATLTEWVKQGAVWPEEPSGMAPIRRKSGITAEDRQWWAFQPVKKITPPEAGGWGANEIDRFIFARLKTEGLQPAPRAEKTALLRRVYFDLIGLPPAPAEIDAFVSDRAPDAYARVVDRLLASPRYGERWATMWLDLVRYAESDGYKADDYRPNAWRYRDYVIQSFNADKPYDRFVQEQLAGDELWPNLPEARIATGYLAHWIYEYNQRDAVGQRQTILNDITDTTADAFLGVGLQCARCHDHKFDPLLQKDYFRLQAFFSAVEHNTDFPVATAEQRAAYAQKLAAWEAKTADLRRQLEVLDAPYRKKAEDESIKKFPPETRAILEKPAAERSPFEQQIATLMWRQVDYAWDEKRFASTVKEPAKSQRNALLAQLKKHDAEKPEPLPASLAVTDVGPIAPPVTIPKKAALGDIAPGYLTLLDPEPARIEHVTTPTTGRRAALAHWITQPDHPLTSRVIVNRLWQAHFGRGISANASDFGRLGQTPSHPELLDWLARSFVENGWSLKKLHRLIVTSETYQQSSASPIAAMASVKDPENRLLWRGSVRRLDAEQIRDAVLATTGELKLRGAGPSDEMDAPVRTVYLKARRNRRDPALEVFDLPERFVSNAERNSTTTPTQALLMLNSRWAQERAGALAKRLRGEGGLDEPAMLDESYRLAFGRRATPTEQTQAREFLVQQATRIAAKEPDGEIVPFVGEKMRFRDGSAAVLLPESTQERLVVPGAPAPASEFTIEAFITMKSAANGEEVRTIVSHGATTTDDPGWVFGVTGKRSHAPQTLVLKLRAGGPEATKLRTDEMIFSGLHIDTDVPYFVAVSVRLDDSTEHGVTFYAKDLTDNDDPLRKVEVMHAVRGSLRTSAPLVIGGPAQGRENLFAGMIDDVRLSEAALKSDLLLLTDAVVRPETAGYWKFEVKEDPFADSSKRDHPIAAAKVRALRPDPRLMAFVDLCHVMLNANEFIYLE